MSVSSITMPFPARLRTPMQIDPVMLVIAVVLMFGGMVILASASMSISDNTENDPFYYVGRQAIAVLLGGAASFACLFVPMRVWRDVGPLMLLIGLALLVLVLVPGVGHTVNGSTRWLRIGAINLQVSEPVRLCLMIYLAGYLVRQNKTLREQFTGFSAAHGGLEPGGRLVARRTGFWCRNRVADNCAGDVVCSRRTVS